MSPREFDPFGALEKRVSAGKLHLLIRIFTIAILIVFLVHRINAYGRYIVKPLWVVETLVFVIFIISYVIRLDPVERSRGVREILIPPIGAMLPFGLLFSMPQPWIYSHPLRLQSVFYFMTVSTALTAWGGWTLRGSFSVTVEARRPVMRGPYRWIRHPVYFGEILTTAAVTLWRFSWLNALIFALFVTIQLLRAGWEEKKLGRVFPEYRDYAVRTFWFLPPS